MLNEKLNLCPNCKARYTPLLYCVNCAYNNESYEFENIAYQQKLKEEKLKTKDTLLKELFRYPLGKYHELRLNFYDREKLKEQIKKTKTLLQRDGYFSGQ